MNRKLKSTLGLSLVLLATTASAQITFYEAEGFRGRTFATNRQIVDFERRGFNDRASSVVVEQGRWEVCEDARFNGRCSILRTGSYDSLNRMGLDNRISSVRQVDARRNYANEAPEPLPAPTYEYRRRPDERVYEATVTSVRAVVGPPEQRCWLERQQVTDSGGKDRNVGGAIAGALIGGILGHQVGGGHGRDLATVGGAVAGTVIGANAGTNNNDNHRQQERDVRRCETTASTTPAYWDVTYNFRGTDHRLQMSADPGRTIAVNRKGEPRQ